MKDSILIIGFVVITLAAIVGLAVGLPKEKI